MAYTKPEPFTIHVSDAELADLRERLDRVRWPGEVPDTGWEYGANLAYIKQLVDYWRTKYDWRAQERELNKWPHFKVTIDGQRIHYLHQRGKGPKPLPLIISHGWPGSIYEFMQILGPLTDPAAHGGDPADAFDVIAPSLPGYGFSDPTHERKVNVIRIGEWFGTLMKDVLGYSRYGAQGGDWGALVTSRLGFAFPQHVVGIHLNMVGVAPHPANRQNLSAAEQAWMQEMKGWQSEETGYQNIQGTKPQTLGYGLNDSPVGLCAWIVEKFRTWSDCNGNPENSYTKDQLLTNVMIYWITQTINSSTRLYYEQRHHPWLLAKDEKITVPTGFAAFPKELARPPREWAERAYNVQRWTPMPAGGHFAAMEKPQLLVDDIRAFFRGVR
ncbi:MAG: epoxide hydrolase [Deltaproteobacteria bacterium]|nr:epoxide hydrolase [Deltaproteobacteria bacterium]